MPSSLPCSSMPPPFIIEVPFGSTYGPVTDVERPTMIR